jgi:two-component system, response regulator PdtaR
MLYLQKSKLKILVAENESHIADDLKNSLERMGYEVSGIGNSGEEVINLVSEGKPDLILMDIILDGSLDGIETAEVLSVKYDIPVIYLADFNDRDTLQRVKITEPYGYLMKPFDSRELEIAIEMAFIKRGISFEGTSDSLFPAIITN